MNWTRWAIAAAVAGGLLGAASCTVVYHDPYPTRVVYAPAPAPSAAPVALDFTWGQPEPPLVVVPGTEIRYVNVPDDDIFFFDSTWYRFWSGNWYYCSRYGGAWIRLTVRPSFVIRIPHTHVKYRVMGPPPARYHWGRPDPRLTIISGTDIRYVDDAADDIFFHGGVWYRWDGRSWHHCRTYGGLWIQLTVRPSFVVRIPHTHVKYRVMGPPPGRYHWGRPNPRLTVISGTDIRYVDDAGDDIFFLGGIWYRWDAGRWYHCRTYGGSWAALQAPPPAFSRIPPGHAKHRVVAQHRPPPAVKPPDRGPRPPEPPKPREVHRVEVRPVPAPPERGRPDEPRGPDREPPKVRDDGPGRRDAKEPEKPKARVEEPERRDGHRPPEPPKARDDGPGRRDVKEPEKPKARVEEPERRQTKPPEPPGVRVAPQPRPAPEPPRTRPEVEERREIRAVPKPPAEPEKPRSEAGKPRVREEAKPRRPEGGEVVEEAPPAAGPEDRSQGRAKGPDGR